MEEDFSPVTWDTASPGKSPQQPDTSDIIHGGDTTYLAPSAQNHENEFESQDLGQPGPSCSSSKPIASASALDDHIFINSTVTDPQKEQDGSQNAYISYLIATESNSPTFQSPSIRVRRRFSDFYFLYSMLYMEYPAVAVPPLPDKSRLEYIKGDRFGTEFTLKRASSLNRFLDRLSHHPVLKRSNLYLIFLETPDWNSFKRSIAARHQQALQENGVLDGLSDSLLNAFARVNQPNDELREVKERIIKLEDNLIHVERAFSKVTKKQSDKSHDFEDFSQQLLKLAGLEGIIESEIVSFAEGTLNYSRGVANLSDQIESDYIVSLRDMQNYVVSVKGLIKLQEQKQLDFEALTEYLHKAKAEKDSIVAGGGSNFILSKLEDVRGVNHQLARNERLQKVETKISSLTEEVAKVKQSSETFQELTINEISIFENIKRQEMKSTLSELADNHIAFYQNIIHQWETVL